MLVGDCKAGDIIRRRRRLWLVIDHSASDECIVLQVPRPAEPGFLSDAWPPHWRAKLVVPGWALRTRNFGRRWERYTIRKKGGA